MKMSSIKRRAWWALILLFLVILGVTAAFVAPYENQHKTTVTPISFTGSYQLSDEAPLKPFTAGTFVNAGTNDTLILTGHLDRALEKDTRIFFYMQYLEVQIFLDSTQLYAWGTSEDHPAFMRSSGAAWGHLVLQEPLLPEDEITIILKSKYTNNYYSAYHDFLNSLQTGDSGALARGVLARNWPFLLAGLLLFLIGLTLQLLALTLAWQKVTIPPSIYYCACFILAVSFWVMLNPIYSTLYWGNAGQIMLMEMLSLWLHAIFLCAYFGTFMRTKAKQANDVLLFTFSLSLVLFLLLQLCGRTDAYAVRSLFSILLLAANFTFAFIYRYEVRHSKNSELHTLAIPGSIYMAFGLLEMFNYVAEWFRPRTALTIGFTIFILAQFALAIRQIRSSLLMAQRAEALEKELVQSRTAIMISQIQPHFLYNALTGIKMLCGSSPEKAEDALEHFAYFLRGNLDSLSDTRLIPFDKEIGHVEDYFYLEQMRFNERVSLTMNLEYRDFLLPAMTLQPLVENAVRYGITKKAAGGTITIHSEKKDGHIILTISDDGVGFDVNVPKEDGRTHTGIENVRSRIQLQCGGTLQIRSGKGRGTEVRIVLPGKEPCR